MKRVVKQLSGAGCAILSLALTSADAFAQCAMCRAAAAASGNDTNWNLAVLVLLVPPVLIFCAIFVVAYRLRAAQGETPKEEWAKRAWRKKLKVSTSRKIRRISPGGATSQ